MAANAPEEVRSLLMDVVYEGSKIVQKKKLLWMLGWNYDKPGAWEELLVHWVNLGKNRHDLSGSEVQDKIVLFAVLPQINRVHSWA